jgi:hypothetical protein
MSLPLAAPFLLRFAQQLRAVPTSRARYDQESQLTRVRAGDRWVDALSAGEDTPPHTIITHVRRETTDNS